MTLCSFQECDKRATRRGWCNTHYERWRKNGDPSIAKSDMTPILIGARFGRWTVTGPAQVRSGTRYYPVRCECGKARMVRGSCLRSGTSRGCGCGHVPTGLTHGLYGHPLYMTWTTMQQRCSNPNAYGYERYGGRGISVCDEWTGAGAFPAFLAHVETLPHYGEPGRTLDRVDNDGNYEPGNVRWATWKEQAANRHNSKPAAVERARVAYARQRSDGA